MFKLKLFILLILLIVGFSVHNIYAQEDSSAITYGSEYAFNSNTTNHVSAVSLSENKALIAYKDYNGIGTAVIGTITDDTISFGSEYIFNLASSKHISIASFSTNRFIATYQDQDNSEFGTSIIGNISNNTISFGSEYIFKSNTANSTTVAYLSPTKFLTTYQDKYNNNIGKAIIGSIPVVCGNNTLEEGEECDDGNVINGDGCSSICEVEPICGNSNLEEGEECDDGNTQDNDGCSSVCQIEEEPDEPEQPDEIEIIDGDLICNKNASGQAQFDIYIVKLVGNKKFKRLILSPHVFESYGHLSWDNVKNTGQTTLDQFITSDVVRAENDTKVYQLFPQGDTGVKRWLDMTAEAFNASYDSDAIYMINQTDRDAYQSGEPIYN